MQHLPFGDNANNYAELDGPHSITTVTIDSSTYALVASFTDNGVQIIDITDPYNPIAASALTDDDSTKLRGAVYITTVTLGSSTFALVASFHDDGVQIIDIIDPYNPIPTYTVSNGADGYTELNGPRSITAVTIGTSTFVLVASLTDSGIQIIKLGQEYMPVNCGQTVPKDKAKKVTSRLNLYVEHTLAKELRSQGAYIASPRVLKWYCISCAIHFGILKIRSESARRQRGRLR